MTNHAIDKGNSSDGAIAKQGKTALKAVLAILEKWKCSEVEKQAALGIGRSTLHKYQKDPTSARITPDLLERMSYILNIHQALRLIFENPENVYGFMRMPNNNPYFNGLSPIQIISSGRMAHLYEVCRRLDSARGGQW